MGGSSLGDSSSSSSPAITGVHLVLTLKDTAGAFCPHCTHDAIRSTNCIVHAHYRGRPNVLDHIYGVDARKGHHGESAKNEDGRVGISRELAALTAEAMAPELAQIGRASSPSSSSEETKKKEEVAKTERSDATVSQDAAAKNFSTISFPPFPRRCALQPSSRLSTYRLSPCLTDVDKTTTREQDPPRWRLRRLLRSSHRGEEIKKTRRGTARRLFFFNDEEE